MPKMKDTSEEEFKRYLTQEYERLLEEEKDKPRKDRRSKREISKQAYAISMAVKRSMIAKQKKAKTEEVDSFDLFDNDFIVMEELINY